VRLTDERLAHIVEHPEMKGMAINAPYLAGFLRREDEKLKAGQVRRIIAAPLSTILSRRSVTKSDPSIDPSTVALAKVEVPQRGTKLEAGRRWMDEKCRDVEF